MVTIRLNTRDKIVIMLQYALNTKVSGIADAEFVSAVKSYQKTKKLTVDGIVGKNTKLFLMISQILKRVRIKKVIGIEPGSHSLE